MFWDIVGAIVFIWVLHKICVLCSDSAAQERAVRELDRKMGVTPKNVWDY